jgi:hypothetical protein
VFTGFLRSREFYLYLLGHYSRKNDIDSAMSVYEELSAIRDDPRRADVRNFSLHKLSCVS